MAEHSYDTLFLLVCQVKYQIFMVLFLPAATCQGRENLLYYSLVITMIYICDNCRFLFSRAAEPEQCPDCGKYTVRRASRGEQQEYQARLRGDASGPTARENPYDDPAFFIKYAQMDRSRQGLPAAGEWHVLEPLLPPFGGQRVLDLGCGYGWHCRYAADHGAAQVIGTDISRRMLQTAQERNAAPVIEYRCAAMEDLIFPDSSFDVVLSSLALHYVCDFAALAERISRWLRPGGTFLFSVEHPVFTAHGSQEWVYDDQGQILHFPVDRYYSEGSREAVFLGEKVTKYHRTLTTYLETLLRCGFTLRHVVEPQPAADMLDIPGMRDELRRPMMLIVSAVRERAGDGASAAVGRNV